MAKYAPMKSTNRFLKTDEDGWKADSSTGKPGDFQIAREQSLYSHFLALLLDAIGVVMRDTTNRALGALADVHHLFRATHQMMPYERLYVSPVDADRS